MNIDMFQWHHPFWGMFQVQILVYISCVMVLTAVSYHRTGTFALIKDACRRANGWLALSMITTVMANLLSASMFAMQAPMPLVVVEAVAALWTSIYGTGLLLMPFVANATAISDMKPQKNN